MAIHVLFYTCSDDGTEWQVTEYDDSKKEIFVRKATRQTEPGLKLKAV